MKITYKQCIDFINIGTGWLQANESESPFKHSVTKVIRQCADLYNKIGEETRNKEQDLEILHKYVLEGGRYSLDKQGFKTSSPVTEQKFLNELRIYRVERQDELNKKDEAGGWLELTPHTSNVIPADLTEEQIKAFTGFVIEDAKK